MTKIAGGGAVLSASVNGTDTWCKDTKCGGRLEPETDGDGRTIDVCRKCGRKQGAVRFTEVVAPAAPSTSSRLAHLTSSSPTASAGKPCTVDGCPGTLDAGSGRCACCEKRAAWAAEHIPKRRCEICEGPIEGRGVRRLCAACRPLKTRANAAAFAAGATTPRKKK